jgi:hypothetical protein
MAYDQARRVKHTMIAALAELLPADDATGQPVPIDYAWPGKAQRSTHVWFVGARTVSEPYAMRAGRKRRLQATAFDIVIEAHLQGATLDAEGRNVLQEQADEIVEEIAGIIDEWVADNVTLGQTTTGSVPIDDASFDSFTLTHGPVDTGVVSVGVVTISYRLRPL